MADTTIYFNTLKADSKRKAVVAALVSNMKLMGVTNPFTQAGILAVVSKESDFTPKNEIPYRNTPNDHIRAVFGSRVSKYTDPQLTNLKANDEAFFNVVYGNMYGNAWNEGYKYRGRGYNQLTFRGNYAQIAPQIGVDIVNNPDLVNNLDVATKVLVQYFKNRFSENGNKLTQYGAKGINDFKDLNNAVLASYHANAGWGNNIATDSTGGKAKAIERSATFLEIVKANPSTTGGVFFLVSAAAAVFLFRFNKKQTPNEHK